MTAWEYLSLCVNTTTRRSLFCKRNFEQTLAHSAQVVSLCVAISAVLCSVWASEARAVTSGWLVPFSRFDDRHKVPTAAPPQLSGWVYGGKKGNHLGVSPLRHWVWLLLRHCVGGNHPLVKEFEAPKRPDSWISHGLMLSVEVSFCASPEVHAPWSLLWFREMNISHSFGLYTVLRLTCLIESSS